MGKSPEKPDRTYGNELKLQFTKVTAVASHTILGSKATGVHTLDITVVCTVENLSLDYLLKEFLTVSKVTVSVRCYWASLEILELHHTPLRLALSFSLPQLPELLQKKLFSAQI